MSGAADQQQAEGICVAIRMRPLNERELTGGQQAVFQCLPGQNAVAQLKEGQPLEGQTYYYDKVFNGQATTAEVYTHIARNAVKNVVNGINGTIFAYGQVRTSLTTKDTFPFPLFLLTPLPLCTCPH